MRLSIRLWACLLCLATVTGLLFLAGCSSSGGDTVYQNISERPAWGALERMCFTSWGGNEIKYLYTLRERGGGLYLLTWSDGDEDYSDEGGSHPAYSPNGETIAFCGRRGTKDGIYTVDADDGDRDAAATLITQPPGDGADSMPSYSPDGNTIVFVTTAFNGTMDLATVAANGTGRAELAGADARVEPMAADATVNRLWPTYTPDGTGILYEQRAVDSDQSTSTCTPSPHRRRCRCWQPPMTRARRPCHPTARQSSSTPTVPAPSTTSVRLTPTARTSAPSPQPPVATATPSGRPMGSAWPLSGTANCGRWSGRRSRTTATISGSPDAITRRKPCSKSRRRPPIHGGLRLFVSGCEQIPCS